MDYKKTAQSLVDLVGGADNISSLRHCMTRLRFVLKDESKADDDKIKAMPEVLGIGRNAGQYQVILGPAVEETYKETAALLGLPIEGAVDEQPGDVEEQTNKKGLFDRFVELVSTIFFPILYPIVGCGMISGLCGLIANMGWVSSESGTYIILNTLANGVFYFLPMLIAFSAAHYFKSNGYVAVAAVAALMHPNLESLVSAGTNIDFLGIPVNVMSYASSIIPIIAMVWVMSLIEHALDKVVPHSLQMVLVPLAELIVAVPLTLIAIGPALTLVSDGIGEFFTYLFGNLLPVGGLLMAVFYPWTVLAGVHLAFVAIQMDMIAKTGVTMIIGFMAVANAAQSGAAFAVFLRTKNGSLKSVAGSAAFSAILGITEPALYGISLRFKKPMIAASIASAIGAVPLIVAHVSATGIGIVPLGSLPLFFGPTFPAFLLGVAISFVAAVILTSVIGFDDVPPEDELQDTEA